MIRIKAPRVFADTHRRVLQMEYGNDVPIKRGRLYSEATHRRVMALVRAIAENNGSQNSEDRISDALYALKAQAEKEAK